MKKINRYRMGYYVNFVLDILIMICAIFIVYLTICINEDMKDLDEQLDILYQQIEELKPVADIPIIAEPIDPAEPKEEETEQTDKTEYPKLYTNTDVIALSKMLWGEARGIKEYQSNGQRVSAKCQQAAVIWTVLNRYDAGFEDSIVKVVTAKSQFVGYRESNPVDEELTGLVTDVLDRWSKEKNGETNVGRVLPADYLWFYGDGQYNHFRNDFNGKVKWTWKLADPYM